MLLFLQQRQDPAALAPRDIPPPVATSVDSISVHDSDPAPAIHDIPPTEHSSADSISVPDSMPSLTAGTDINAPPPAFDAQGLYQDLQMHIHQMPPQEIIPFNLDVDSTASNSALHSDIDENPYDSTLSDPGFTSDSSTFSSGSFNSEIDAAHIRNLILSAQLWLYSIQLNPDRYGMTQPLINAITYLHVFYADTIAFADADSIPLPPIDWDRVPTVADTTLPDTLPPRIPRQIRFLLSLQGYYANIAQILAERQFETPRQRFIQARHFPPAILYLTPDEIPIQEQEDPPDNALYYFSDLEDRNN